MPYMAETAPIALGTMPSPPMKADLFRFYNFHGVLLVFVFLNRIVTLKHFPTFRAFMLLSAAMAVLLMSFQALDCEHFFTLIAFGICHINVIALFMVLD